MTGNKTQQAWLETVCLPSGHLTGLEAAAAGVEQLESEMMRSQSLKGAYLRQN